MRNVNNNIAFGPPSRIPSQGRQRISRRKPRIVQGKGVHSPASLTSGQRWGQRREGNHDEPTEIKSFDDAVPLPRLSFLTSALLIASLSIVTFWNTCRGDFVFDDLEAIIKNQDVRPETPVRNLLWHDFWGQEIELKESHKSYRPLTVLTFRLNYYFGGGLHPWGFHLVNILLHALVSVLVLPISSALLTLKTSAGKRGDAGFLEYPRASLLCAILFAVHPIHTENVAGVVGRADLLCALFFFLSFMVYRNACYDSFCHDVSPVCLFLRIILSMVLCAVAMLCKEQGITVIGICSIYDITINCGIDPIPALNSTYTTLKRHRLLPSLQLALKSPELQWLRRLFLRQFLLIISATILLFTRFYIMGTGAPTFQQVDNPASFLDNIWMRIINYNYIYSLNAWLLLFPWWLCFDWSMGCIPVIQTPLDPRVVAPTVFWIIMGFLVSYCLCGSAHYERRLLTVSLSSVIIPFLPASNVFFTVGFVIAERVLYLPSLGFCLLVVLGTRHLCANESALMKRTMQILLFTIVISHMTRCYHRNSEWLTERTLYRSGLKVCPGNAKVHYNIGKSASDEGLHEEAIAAYRKAIRLHPDYDQALNNLGNILRDLNQTEEAEMLISKAVKIRPTFAAAWMNLGIVQATLKKHEEAETSYLTALKHRKNYPDCYFNLGNLYLVQGNANQALSAWQNATTLLNTHAEAWSNTLLLLDNLGQYDNAVSVGREALRHVSDDAAIYYAMGNVLAKMEQYKEAEEMYLKAVQFRPDAASYHGNLGVLYHRWGKLEEAYERYQRSLTLDPSSQVTAENMRKLGQKLKKKGTV